MKIDETTKAADSSMDRKQSNDSELAEDSLQPLMVRRKSGMIQKKFPSLQISHYPVLLLSKNGINENQSSVTWKTSQQSDSTDSELMPTPPVRKFSGNLKQSPIPPMKKKSLDFRANEDRPKFVRNFTATTLSPTNEKPPSILGSSSGRLHASPKVSFSSIVQHTMKCKAMGGMGSGRCLSSASPISAVERQQLWGSSMHHSFDDRPTASSDDLFASCNDIDQAYRQQRKRRAGISSGSTTVTRDMPFACAGGNGFSSAGVSNGKGYPTLGGRSPQSSFDSNQDVAQISMNWMRMNGLGPSLRPFLNGNHTPKKTQIQNSQSTTQISRIGSLRRMHAADASIDGKYSLCGTQPDVSMCIAGETASRKSVSIAYSNDIEAGGKGGGNGDDSTVPLMDDKDENSGGRLIKREILHERRRIVCDRALGFAIIGIMLMIIENELASAYKFDEKLDPKMKNFQSIMSKSLGLLIIATTAALLSFVGYFHVIEIQLFMNANAADDWMVALTTRRIVQIIVEILVCLLCPLPFDLMHLWDIDKTTSRHFNIFLSIAMFFRLYWVCRVMLLHSRLFTDASSRSIAGLNRVNFNARFILKTLMTLCPGTMLMIFTASLWVIAGWILRLCEQTNVTKTENLGYVDSIWLVAITFLSVGYGDIVPKTNCGRSMALVTGILGTCASSMVVAVIARKLELTRAEKHVHNFMQDTQLTKQLKHSAANVLRETWFIYKYRKLVDKCDFGKVRQHQRKFLVAIYEMRRVKRDQRKLAENLVSLGDVAKTSSNTYELVHDVHSTQEGLSLRITAIEHQLSDISRELSSLTELLRGSVIVASEMNNERRAL